jgi:hypothetical protein
MAHGFYFLGKQRKRMIWVMERFRHVWCTRLGLGEEYHLFSSPLWGPSTLKGFIVGFGGGNGDWEI